MEILNNAIAERLNTQYMKLAIEEVLVPHKEDTKCFVNFSKKSYMFTYCQ